MRIKKGQDVVLRNPMAVPYRRIRPLGQGGYSTVDEVRDKHTNAVYARKVYKPRYNEDDDAVEAQFREEVRIMRRLPHHHITTVHASYILREQDHPPVLAMILEPVARDGTLQDLLEALRETGCKTSTAEKHLLERCFGCLSSALKHIHQRAVRHKDIKPGNILLDGGRILLSDFGNAFDGTELGATTSGPAASFTREYCAPEVQASRKRNAKSDMFSLGCVYVDLLHALFPKSIMVRPQGTTYADLAPSVRKQLSRTEDIPQNLWVATYKLLDSDSSKRLTSETLLTWLESFHRSTPSSVWDIFCAECLGDKVPEGDQGHTAGQATTDALSMTAPDSPAKKTSGHRHSGSDSSFVVITDEDLPSPELSVYVQI